MRLNEHKNTSTDYRRAKDLRNNASPYEKKLWVVLREAAAVHGLKFRRQFAVHPFIADFACLKARLLIEIDGDSHDARPEYDAVRDPNLLGRDFHVMRFSNDDVGQNVVGVVETIILQAENLLKQDRSGSLPNAPLPDPPHEGEGNLSQRQSDATH